MRAQEVDRVAGRNRESNEAAAGAKPRRPFDITYERAAGERVRADHGQLLPLYAVVVLIAGGSMVLLVHLGVLALHRAQARSAADAAALAGAAEGRDAADEVARRNGAVLESFIALGTDVEVRVRVGSTHATARARRDGGCRSSVQSDPVHFAPCPPTSPG